MADFHALWQRAASVIQAAEHSQGDPAVVTAAEAVGEALEALERERLKAEQRRKIKNAEEALATARATLDLLERGAE